MWPYLRIFLLFGTLAQPSWSAVKQPIWGEPPPLPFLKSEKIHGFTKVAINNNLSTSDYSLQKLEEDADNPEDQRYQLTYKGLPIWGYQLIVHQRADSHDFVTGFFFSELETDLGDTARGMSADKVSSFIQNRLHGKVISASVKKIIYIDTEDKAHLAYHSYYFNEHGQLHQLILDAGQQIILEDRPTGRKEALGQGLGGNEFRLYYREGIFQYGDHEKGLNSLEKFEVNYKNHQCRFETPEFRIIYAKKNQPAATIPISRFKEIFHGIKAYRYPCSKETGFVHRMDDDQQAIHFSYSAVNDAMYFAVKTHQMLHSVYGFKKPWGKDIPIRIYTHIKEFNNAIAFPAIRRLGFVFMHQQIQLGDGKAHSTAHVQGVLAHELGHLFTANHSGLDENPESVALDEAFSDMTALALMDYIRKDHPWYWDGLDWTFGREIELFGWPIRYLDHPSRDGHSIEHYKNFSRLMDEHLTCGIMNRAFYLLANQPGWSITQAYQLMADANSKYWQPRSGFVSAACGVIQAARDHHYPEEGVRSAFLAVGLDCDLLKDLADQES